MTIRTALRIHFVVFLLLLVLLVLFFFLLLLIFALLSVLLLPDPPPPHLFPPPPHPSSFSPSSPLLQLLFPQALWQSCEASSAAPPRRPIGSPVSSVLWRRAGGHAADYVQRCWCAEEGGEGRICVMQEGGSQERGKGERKGKQGRRGREGVQK